MKFCIVALFFIVGSATCIDLKNFLGLGLTKGHVILPVPLGNYFNCFSLFFIIFKLNSFSPVNLKILIFFFIYTLSASTDCAVNFQNAVLRLKAVAPANQKPLLEQMVNNVEGAKECFLLDNQECLRNDIRVIGVDGFTQLASLATGKLQQVYLTAKQWDIETLKQTANIQSGNLLQFLFESIPKVCSLLNRKANLINSYVNSVKSAKA